MDHFGAPICKCASGFFGPRCNLQLPSSMTLLVLLSQFDPIQTDKPFHPTSPKILAMLGEMFDQFDQGLSLFILLLLRFSFCPALSNMVVL